MAKKQRYRKMAEKRLPVGNLTLLRGREGSCKIEVFRKSQWTNDPADDYKYRLRVNGRWASGKHSKRHYVNQEGLLAEVRKALTNEDIL